MKLIRISFVIAIAALAIVGLSSTSYAFHDGGVAYCEGCHTMHNSLQGTAMIVAGGNPGPQGNIFLLQGVDQSSTCLNCHGKDSTQSSYHISTKSVVIENNSLHQVPVNETPGGDFAWVKIGYSSTGTNGGERHGHNIVASDFGYVADNTNTKAPGATTDYPATSLSCISCHDPHPNARIDSTGAVVYRNTAGTFPTIEASGSYGATPSSSSSAVGVYRILGGTGYRPRSLSDAGIGPVFANNPPFAVAPSTYNRSEASSDTHVAYGSGMAQWCANCHDKFLNTGNGIGANNTGGHVHPAGAALDTTIMNNYNAYVMSGNMTGDGTNSYWSLVPVEEGTSDRSVLASHATNTAGIGYTAATTSSTVMCLSCHRAHASAFNSMIRWFNNDSFVTEDGAYVTNANGVAPNTDAQASKAYYDRPATKFAAFQRVLCNKCHAKD